MLALIFAQNIVNNVFVKLVENIRGEKTIFGLFPSWKMVKLEIEIFF
jgi:hypothetical protein